MMTDGVEVKFHAFFISRCWLDVERSSSQLGRCKRGTHWIVRGMGPRAI